MSKLHEQIALRKGEIGRNKSRITEIYKRFQKPVTFSGFVKNYEPVDEGGEELPPENKRVQSNVFTDLQTMNSSLRRLWETVGSVESGNCQAKGDIIAGGRTLMSDVPVTMLLFLENQLVDLRTTVEKIPTLSPDFDWTKDENDGLYKTPVVKTHRNKKVTRAIVKYDATEHHPAQTDLITVDELAGYWNSVQHSGAMPTTLKISMLGRVEELLDAVKSARARANISEAPKVDCSNIIEFLFED